MMARRCGVCEDESWRKPLDSSSDESIFHYCCDNSISMLGRCLDIYIFVVYLCCLLDQEVMRMCTIRLSTPKHKCQQRNNDVDLRSFVVPPETGHIMMMLNNHAHIIILVFHDEDGSSSSTMGILMASLLSKERDTTSFDL